MLKQTFKPIKFTFFTIVLAIMGQKGNLKALGFKSFEKIWNKEVWLWTTTSPKNFHSTDFSKIANKTGDNYL